MTVRLLLFAVVALFLVWAVLHGCTPEEVETVQVVVVDDHRPWTPTMPATTTSTTTTTTTPPRARTAPIRSVWDRLAACESGGNWSINTGNGYYGGLQFSAATWAQAGGRRYARNAHLATRAQQIAIAEAWLARTSWAQWPWCSRHLGLR